MRVLLEKPQKWQSAELAPQSIVPISLLPISYTVGPIRSFNIIYQLFGISNYKWLNEQPVTNFTNFTNYMQFIMD